MTPQARSRAHHPARALRIRINGTAFALVLLVAVLAAPAVAAAADLPFSFTDPYRLVVPFESQVLVPSEDGLAQACATSSVIRGCTVFFARRLDCMCFGSDSGWRIHARAQFIPRIVLSPSAALQHERMHIDEVRSAVTEHLATLTSIEFSSSVDCETRSHKASAAFPSVMDEFQRQSNARHHPMYSPQPLATLDENQ